ncbi:MAG: hypothetical protein NTW19_20070 [Planctomycetota bacterium]|nr:hypothetical protein [Planctomycetota bacterium]
MTPYLRFVLDTLKTLQDKQSAAIAGSYHLKPVHLTITANTGPNWTSVAKRGDHYDKYPCVNPPVDTVATRLDLDAWAWLERLSDVTGDGAHRERVDQMAADFADYGFDPRSGLAYFGNQAQFDVVRLGPAGIGPYAVPSFKPWFGLPLDALWRHAPEKMARCMRSAWLGLVTRDEDLSYNRHCCYGQSDRDGEHFMKFEAMHVAFAQTGACLIHWWSDAFIRTGEIRFLEWAEAMAVKWAAVQSPKTGLVPHWFGADSAEEKTQPPRTCAHVMDVYVGHGLVEAAGVLRRVKPGAPGAARAEALAKRIEALGLGILRGIATFGYDDEERLFPNWLNVGDGVADRETIYYAFQTQAQKKLALKVDPTLEAVSIFRGESFYRAGPWHFGTPNPIPLAIARAAEKTGDALLLDRAKLLGRRVLEDAAQLTGPLNAEGHWTFDASASYIEMFLSLHRATGDEGYLRDARKLADMELKFLACPAPEGKPEWWRLPTRNALPAAMLELHVACVAE